jgi:hypothetical protein
MPSVACSNCTFSVSGFDDYLALLIAFLAFVKQLFRVLRH